MKQINLPLPFIGENEPLEISVAIGKEKRQVNFKVASFLWDNTDELSTKKDATSLSLARITRLKNQIETYDSSWELIQIFAPLEKAKYIRVLYRKMT